MPNDSVRIRKTTIPNKFVLVWREAKEFLILDFNPILQGFGLEGPYVLIHRQGKPKGLRTWGIYDSSSQSYFSDSFEGDQPLIGISEVSLLQLNENIHKTLPTAVIYIPNITIEQVLNPGGSGYG